MALFALTVGRNESGRYLDAMLEWTSRIVDAHFFYDDHSDDDTLARARNGGAFACVRDPAAASFMQNESDFREGAWHAFERTMHPEDGDWVLFVDCDEFYKASRATVVKTLKYATVQGCKSIRLPIREVFGWDLNGSPLVRTDGYWFTITGPRLVRYETGGTFEKVKDSEGNLVGKRMGCLIAPTYILEAPDKVALDSEILHFGYARPEDREVRYNRYVGLPGHNEGHIASILRTPELTRWVA